MKKNLKLFIYIVLMFVLFTTMIAASAATEQKVTVNDNWLSFDVWIGSGDVSVLIPNDWIKAYTGENLINFSDFESLNNRDGKIIENSFFYVTDSDGATLITLKEDYLKTLSDGCYHFNADFKYANVPLNLYIVTTYIEVSDMCFSFDPWNGVGRPIVALPTSEYGITFWSDLFESLSYNGKEIESKNYSISSLTNTPIIMLNEEYVRNLAPGDYYFIANFVNIKGVMLKLTIPGSYTIGDIDNDGKVTSKDARLALRASAKLENLSQTQILAADINHDGQLHADDARILLRIAAQIEDIEYYTQLK